MKGPGDVLDTTLTRGDDTPWRRVHAMRVEAALDTPGALSNSAPQVFQTARSDFCPGSAWWARRYPVNRARARWC